MAAFALPLVGGIISGIGHLFGLGGPSAAQKADLQNQQNIGQETKDFFNQWTSNANTVFGEQQGLLKNITSNLTPILQAGPSQQGFSPQELAARNTQAINQAGAANTNARIALGGHQNANLPSGAQAQLDAALASRTENNLGNQLLDITNQNYEQGNANWKNALTGLGQTAAQENPIQYAQIANEAGKDSFSEYGQLAGQQAKLDASKSAGIGSLFSALGGGFGNLDTTGSSTAGEQVGNFFAGL